MTKYKRKCPEVIEAVQYSYGMEYGVHAYELFSNNYIGEYEKGEAYPKVCLKPYVYDHHGDPVTFNWDDYLVTYEDKSKRWINKDDFEKDYEKV